MKHVYLGRQPILDTAGSVVAYEILYRDGHEQMHIEDNRFASAVVINNILNKFGTHSLLGNRRAFIKIDEKFLMNDLIFSVPKEYFIFSIFEDIDLNERVIERIQQLHEKEYLLAINDVTITEDKMQEYAPILNELSYIKINLSRRISLKFKEIVAELKTHDIKVVGCKIELLKEYKMALNLGCDLFEGYYFAKPHIVENAKYEPSQMNILKLYNMLITDTNIDEITAEFEKNPEVTVQLLRFTNSCAFHFRNKISSIHHILTLMGRQPLAKWLMLMIYSKSVNRTSMHSPLMLLVKQRTELMEAILKVINPGARSNALGEAYFVGLLSLLDTLFSIRLEDILKEMNTSDEVKVALLNGDGILGEIYTLIKDNENFNTQALAIFSEKHNLDPTIIEELYLHSIEDMNNFEELMTA